MDQYAVVGNPIEHSKSPLIHALFAEQTGQQLEYGKLLAPLDGFEASVRDFLRTGLGVNVTVPFKEQAWALVDAHSAAAERAGAVNTILRREDGSLLGDNTDGKGLVRDIQVNAGLSLAGLNVLLVGAGGAARGVIQPLLAAGPAHLCVINRTVSKAEELAALFVDQGPIAAAGLQWLVEPVDLIINATSASLAGDVPPMPHSLIKPGHTWCYDMMYSNGETAFNQWARKHGAARCIDGLGMLVEQAAEAFALWRGVRPDTAPVLTRLRQA
ncbi:shikimate dehydrogenase [Halopseudomonas sabulinigri]|uniref:Shikimate dehydrogenase (NADP(+)) n=1 Tax=Halopseudomonas sabulinigri TaxID=472181 RepID=A0A1H1TXK3_9GAMM|nr:shikimate dehydrogenase [Halopseudomonas sabulinigri]SDS64950.1 shikimate dehydrogenase [Halopseudomonas sabulinigri]